MVAVSRRSPAPASGWLTAALALRVRETAVLSNIIFGILLIFCGVNVPLSAMPAWMGAVAAWLPLTHGIAAARGLAGGAAWSDVAGLVGTEARSACSTS